MTAKEVPPSQRWLRTLNVTDAPAHTDAPHCGSIGHVLPFEQSCRLAQQFGFDAVNADREFLKQKGPDAVADLLQAHGLAPGVFAFSAAFNACYTDAQFEASLDEFGQDLKLCRRAGFRTCVGYVQPSSHRLTFHDHFALLCSRLKRIKTFLAEQDMRLGLEFIGPTTMRRQRRYDFIHTLDGLRSLIAAADAKQQVGIKLDSMHWHTSGAGRLEIEKLGADEVLYVELNDGLAGGYDRFELPEFERELPGETGVIDLAGMLGALDGIGFCGPVVVEPWNQTIRDMPPEKAIEQIKTALDRSIAAAEIKD